MNYLIWKLIHVASVIIFLGNIITGLFWAARANKTRDFKLIASTFQGIIQSDRYFTLPGIVAAIYGRIPILGTGWILWPIILFSISGIIFSVCVTPLEKKIENYALNAVNSEKNLNTYEKMYKQWEVWGFSATVTPVAAMVIMILKPSLPGL
ncbi:MAG TPA: DUF2269 family protein [Ignavibacteriaceae bacterium]